MGIIAWLVVGLIAGFIASKIINRTGEGFFQDIVLGIIGAIVGGAIFGPRLQGVTRINLGSVAIPEVGSVIVLVVYHLIIGQRAA
jgi:uncharacterized membrane protein YeaQ/YmgE (transglycosylase-associated protein family)